MNRSYGIGFDIGIGSVGWAIISWTNMDNDARIEDFGVRLFDSGEIPKTKERKNQKRRAFRSVRRLIRRRKHRKDRAKRFMQKIGMINQDQLQSWQQRNGNQNIFEVRLRGLSAKLSPEEIADCIIHICNHRGYREFYEDMDDNKENEGKIKAGLTAFEDKFSNGNYKSVADMILNNPDFSTNTKFPNYHNHKSDEDGRYILIKREHLRKELMDILKEQQKHYYKELSDDNISFLCDEIVFAQRDFETGPGEEGDKDRKFMGFLDSLGQCMFYKNQRRAFRSSVIGDIYALVNSVSQLTFVNKKTGEISLTSNLAESIIQFALENGEIKEADINKIAKGKGLEIHKSEKLNIPDTVKTIRILKDVLNSCGYNYAELIQEDQFKLDSPSKLSKLCNILNTNITPRRRVAALDKAGWNKNIQEALLRKKFGGTASVCEQYMVEAIDAFKKGNPYGVFQARKMAAQAANISNTSKDIIPSFTKTEDADIVKNAVVFKAINETRKVLNAIVRKYGSPSYINIEVADDLGHSVEERNRIEKLNRANEKERNRITDRLIENGLRKEGEVKYRDILRYRLWEQQEGVDIYTGLPIPENDVLDGPYDIDHIVPFSLILDDTIHNKALVNMGANRMQKGQKVPREYLIGQQLDTFLKNVNLLYKKKKINEKKYKYLMLPNLNDTSILDEWKSRNINDTRYITRYIVNYLSRNLKLSQNNGKGIFAVKGAITSRMRKLWLNKKTWGSQEKRRENNLHHAVDAIVVANLTPKYIEIASDTLKLMNIYRDNNRRINCEYKDYLQKAVIKMVKYYGCDDKYVRELLEKKKNIPSMVRNLRDEVDKRVVDDSFDAFSEDLFKVNVGEFYNTDKNFASQIQVPLVSYKPNKKFKGAITAENPLGKENAKSSSVIEKVDALGNSNVLDARKYYCVEIYKNKDGDTCVRGIRFVDLKKHDKKLYLVCNDPVDYEKHVMYLFNNDYIKIFKGKELKFKGYYKSIKDISRKRIYCCEDNKRFSNDDYLGVAKKDVVKKYSVDILGKIGGEVRCSEPFMLLKQTK